MSTTMLSNLLATLEPPKPVLSGSQDAIKILRKYTDGMPVGAGGWAIHVIPANRWKGPTQRLDQFHTPYAYSDIGSRVTYLKGDVFNNWSPKVIQRMLAHELGHIALNTKDEDKANRWADAFLK
jgi:hypothetical protein